jgi:hypothetical protein
VSNAGAFPYAGGSIGTIGYDVVAKQFLSPNTFKDIMGYCDPSWISDFNYDRMFTRISYVNSTADMVVTDPERVPGRYRSILVEPDGSLILGRVHRLADPPMSEKKPVALLDDNGNPVATVSGYFYPLSHQAGGILLVQDKWLAKSAGVRTLAPQGLGKLEL